MLLPLLSVLVAFSDPPEVYSGRDNRLKVPIPRIENAIVVVEGRLDEAVWGRAALLNGFSQFQPVDGVASVDSTQVLVWYSPTAIHFGIRGFEAHGAVNARLSDRDRIFSDDHVQIVLGTFNDGRQALVFAVNPLGVQADGTINEGGGGRQTSGGLGGNGTAAREQADLSANFVFQSKGRITDYGFEVEVRIPFKSIRYQPRDVQDWGLHVIRQVQHLGHEDSWAPARRDRASFLAQSGTLSGLHELRRGLVVDLNPSVVARQTGGARPSGWGYDPAGPEFGGNVRWGVTNNLTLNGTLNPDFSQVEADVGVIEADPRRALFFPERRPFFLEGIESFATPNSLIYTRAIVKPDAAVKLTGKIAGTNVALLSAVDDRTASASGNDHPVFTVLRMTRDLGGQSRLGAVYTDRTEGGDYNRVAGADARIVFGKIYSLRLQGAASRTSSGGTAKTSPLWEAALDRSGRRFGISYRATGIDEDFVAASGFIAQAGNADFSASHRATFFGKPGALVETGSFTFRGMGTWKYDRFMDGKAVQDEKWHFVTNLSLRGGWRVNLSTFIESFGYDPGLYPNYFVERRTASVVDTIPFRGTPRLPNHDYVISVNTPAFSRFSGSLFYLWGIDENFYEWASADILWLNASLAWRPTDKLRVEGQYQQFEYNRRTDQSTVGIRKIPRLKLEYQLARPVFVRVVGQYDARQTDALRDDSRTNGRLLIRSSDGTFSPIPARTSNNFRVDWLFSYQPTPGTVVFAGYGSTLIEPVSLQFKQLRRRDDGLFVKMSYLYRL